MRAPVARDAFDAPVAFPVPVRDLSAAAFGRRQRRARSSATCRREETRTERRFPSVSAHAASSAQHFEDRDDKRAEAKYKLDRRMGQNIWGRPKSPVNRREYGPGQHGQRRKGKLSDFGTVQVIRPDGATEGGASQAIKGTPLYMAPEHARGTPEQKSDVWAVGLVAVAMLLGQHPYPDEIVNLPAFSLIFKIGGDESCTPIVPDDASAEMKAFLGSCFKRDAAQRPTAAQLLKHTLFDGVKAKRKAKIDEVRSDAKAISESFDAGSPKRDDKSLSPSLPKASP